MSKPHNLLLLMICIGLLAHIVTPQAPSTTTMVDKHCNALYDPDSQRAYNIMLLIQKLANQAIKGLPYYSTGTDNLYGQYYCRADISSDLCSHCIQEAAFNPCFGDYYIVWYKECTLRYDNRSTVGSLDLDLASPDIYSASVSSTVDATENVKFGSVVKSTMKTLITNAAYGNGSLGFATGEGRVEEEDGGTLYCLVQCSPDLQSKMCEKCLQSAYQQSNVSNASNGTSWKRWMSVYFPSCQMTYNSYGAFYGLSIGPHDTPAKGKKASNYILKAVIPAVLIGLLTLLGISFCLIRRKKATTSEETGMETTECAQFDLKTIESATNSFSVSNKLGQGGFGIVYQGVLNGGQEIAVKRLSKNSGQGAKEFKTEVEVVAKLQHKNLVRLVGCCIDREERLLVYEFLQNLSLDHFLYDAIRSAYLTWTVRHKLIIGIARGLHYLHEDSRVKIVHRDLKISNILLDENLEPKIADFGLAKLVEVDHTSDNTSKIVGTYGYMSPEYALAGRYSTKSDVYSFGVIVLEILSGKAISRFYEISKGESLLGYAWRVWDEGAVEKLMDPTLQNNYTIIEAQRCLQIGLLCIQDDEAYRPHMHAVLVMLNSNNVEIPSPFSPSHSCYINKQTSGDETEEGTSKQHQNDSSKSSITLSALEKSVGIL